MPKEGPFVLIVNRQFAELDELILLNTLHTDELPIHLIDRSIQKLNVRLSPFYFDPKPKKNKPLSFYLQSRSSQLKQAFDSGSSTAIFIGRTGRQIKDIPRKRSLNPLFKTIRKNVIPLVLVHLDYQLKDGITPVSVSVRVGQTIGDKAQKPFQKTSRFRNYILAKMNARGAALEIRSFYFNEQKEASEIIDPLPQDLIEKDIQALKYHNLISSQSDFDIFIASTTQLPTVIKEIGRLREITFRAVEEGTGTSCDLDEYDVYYDQLFIWDRVNRKIVGGYRMGRGDEIFQKYGVEGFYVDSLFKIKEGFYPIMQKSVELGRSFIVEEYQRKRLPLFLLWKGILYFLLRNPKYQYLYGPLSISKYYSMVSKSIIVEFVKRYYYDTHLASFLEPRKPFKPTLDNIDIDLLLDQFGDSLSLLDNFIEDIEPNHFKIPVLMKQYIKQNARFISFNLDPNFSDVLDGFMILDLKEVPYATLEALQKES